MIGVLVLILIGLIALGWAQAKKLDTIALDDSNFTGNAFEGMKTHEISRFPNAVYYKGVGMTPKEYGERHGNGKCRKSHTNRLKFKK